MRGSGALFAKVAPFAVIGVLIGSIFVIRLEPHVGTVPEPTIAARDAFYGLAVSGERVWLAGSGGKILRSDDGGATWRRLPSATGQALQGLALGRDGVLVAVGNGAAAQVSADGGETWTASEVEGGGDGWKLLRVRADAAGRFWALGEMGRLLVAEDGRAFRVARPAEDIAWNDIAFADGERGWAVGEFGFVLTTADGGATWDKAQSPVGGSLMATAACRTAEGGQVAVAVGLQGAVLLSDDAGRTWRQVSSGTREHLFDVACGEGRWVAVGDRGVALGGDLQGARVAALPLGGAENVWRTAVAIKGDDLILAGAGAGMVRGGRWKRFSS